MYTQFKEHYLEHLLEPTKLLMTWQHNETRSRYTVAELNRSNDSITLQYLVNTPDFRQARKLSFNFYPAFPATNALHEGGVLDALMRRLPPKKRTDYTQYLHGFRIPDTANLSDFALLGYTGAKLLSDRFAIINPFFEVTAPFDLLLEVAGYGYVNNVTVECGNQATFQKEYNTDQQEEVIKILVGSKLIGYVSRALIPYFIKWMNANRVVEAWVEKKNGKPDQPVIYLYVKISSQK